MSFEVKSDIKTLKKEVDDTKIISDHSSEEETCTKGRSIKIEESIELDDHTTDDELQYSNTFKSLKTPSKLKSDIKTLHKTETEDVEIIDDDSNDDIERYSKGKSILIEESIKLDVLSSSDDELQYINDLCSKGDGDKQSSSNVKQSLIHVKDSSSDDESFQYIKDLVNCHDSNDTEIKSDDDDEPFQYINDFYKRNTSEEQQQSATSNALLCAKCKTRFQTPSQLSQHLNAETCSSNVITCGVCKMFFKTQSELTIHQRRHSLKSKLELHPYTPSSRGYYSCYICTKKYCNISLYDQHLKKHDKPYYCDHCIKGFDAKKGLITHMKTHYHFGPFSCQFCKKDYTLEKSLRRHIRKKHSQKPDSFICRTCNILFECKLAFDEHKYVHHEIRCKICDKKFTRQHKLNFHMKKHVTKPSVDISLLMKYFHD